MLLMGMDRVPPAAIGVAIGSGLLVYSYRDGFESATGLWLGIAVVALSVILLAR